MARNKAERWPQIEKFALADALWKELATNFGYLPVTPALLDFVFSLFRAVTPLGVSSSLDPHQSLVFLNRWKDSAGYREAFETISKQAEQSLNILAVLNQIEDVRPLLAFDTYRHIDLRILADIRDGLFNGTLSPPWKPGSGRRHANSFTGCGMTPALNRSTVRWRCRLNSSKRCQSLI